MTAFAYRGGELHAESVALSALAERHGTPAFVYSRAALEAAWRAFDAPFGDHPHRVCYAVKANSNLAVLDVLARLGSGFDIVSEGELARVLAAGGRADRCVFAGVGKRPGEMRAAIEAGVRSINVESAAELDALSGVARAMGRTARVSLRVNPDVDARTHPYISTGLKDNKFGIPIAEAPALYRAAREMPGIAVSGVDCHIGSQLTELAPIEAAIARLLGLVDALAAEGIVIDHLNVGGGVGVCYDQESPPAPADYVSMVRRQVGARRLEVLTEPGRAIAGNAGVMLTRVLYTKTNGNRRFAVVDAAMNDLIRPALYQAWHDITPVRAPAGGAPAPALDVVGPVCESADFIAKDRPLHAAPGDLLAVRSAGAYAFVMSSNYNSRPRAVEIMVDGDDWQVVRRRESVADLYAHESRLA